MLTLLYILTFIAFMAVLATLVMGAVAMGGKKEDSREKSNTWMRRRVAAQAIAIVLLILTMYMRRQAGG